MKNEANNLAAISLTRLGIGRVAGRIASGKNCLVRVGVTLPNGGVRLPKFVGSPSPVIIEPEDRAQPRAPLAHWECACFSGILFALNRLEIYDCLVSVVGIYGCLNYGESDAVALASVKAVYNAMGQVQTPPGSASKDWMIVDT